MSPIILVILPLLIERTFARELIVSRQPSPSSPNPARDCSGVYLVCCDVVTVDVDALLVAAGWGGVAKETLTAALGEDGRSCSYAVTDYAVEGVGADSRIMFNLMGADSDDPFSHGVLTISYHQQDPSNSSSYIPVLSGFLWSRIGAFELAHICPDDMGDCQHLLMEVDATAMSDAEGGGSDEMGTSRRANRDFISRDANRQETSNKVQEISVSAYYTEAFKNVTTDPEDFIENAFGEATLSFLASQVPVKFTARCVEEAVGLEEKDDAIQMILAFQDLKGTVSALRKSCDVAFLFVASMSSCGVAYTNGFTDGYNVGVVSKPCAVPNFSLAHELAHMFGAAHERERGVRAGNDYGYGHFVDDAGGSPSGYRTAMAYSKTGYRRRIGWFSNPRLSIANLTLGVEGSEDAARLLQENAASMAAVGDESQEC